MRLGYIQGARNAMMRHVIDWHSNLLLQQMLQL